MKEFTNEVFLNFADPSIAKKQRKALKAVRAQFGKEYPNYINGKAIYTDAKTVSINPSENSEVI